MNVVVFLPGAVECAGVSLNVLENLKLWAG